jgi:ketosteroid isomerase-like protein
MSRENVEIVRGRIDAFNRGDQSAWLASLNEDYEIAPLDDWPDARAIRGGEAGWDFYRDVAEILSFERVRVEFVDAGVEKVLGHQRHAAHGRKSGADVEIDRWFVTTLREGKVLRDEWFTDRADALKAAGLSE